MPSAVSSSTAFLDYLPDVDDDAWRALAPCLELLATATFFLDPLSLEKAEAGWDLHFACCAFTKPASVAWVTI